MYSGTVCLSQIVAEQGSDPEKQRQAWFAAISGYLIEAKQENCMKPFTFLCKPCPLRVAGSCSLQNAAAL